MRTIACGALGHFYSDSLMNHFHLFNPHVQKLAGCACGKLVCCFLVFNMLMSGNLGSFLKTGNNSYYFKLLHHRLFVKLDKISPRHILF